MKQNSDHTHQKKILFFEGPPLDPQLSLGAIEKEMLLTQKIFKIIFSSFLRGPPKNRGPICCSIVSLIVNPALHITELYL